MSTQRASAWSVTINNPGPKEEEEIALARQRGWKVEGQLEKGEEGTPHYQLLVKTPQVRFSSVKKAFSRAHIEIGRDVHALQAYVHKEQTRVAELPTSQDAYPSLTKFWELIFNYLTWTNEVIDVDRLIDSDEVVVKEEHQRMWNDPLIFLDEAVNYLIHKGYFVEGIACNPSTRQAWKKYNVAIMTRAWLCAKRTQTARQTDVVQAEQNVVVPTIITDASQDDESACKEEL